MTDQISRRIKIRIMAMGCSSLKSFVEDYKSNGGVRPYSWWRNLSEDSPYSSLVEASECLGVSVDALIGRSSDSDSVLIREGVPAGRINLNE